MKLNLCLLLGVIMMTAAWTYFTDTTIKPTANQARQITNFEFKTLNGGQTGETDSLYVYQGKIILLHFWATWCAPCVTELPQLMTLAKAHPDKIRVIAIAVNDKPDDIQRFLKKHDLPENFIVGLDLDKSISQKLYGTIKLPETFIIDKKLNLYEKIIGSEENWNNPTWRTKLLGLEEN